MKKILTVLLLSSVYAIMGFKEPVIPAWNVWIEIGIAMIILLACMILNKEKMTTKGILSFLLFFVVLLVMKLDLLGAMETSGNAWIHFILLFGILGVILLLNKETLKKERTANMKMIVTFILILAVIHMLRMDLLGAILPDASIPVGILVSFIVAGGLIFWNKEQLK
jgi:CDP-diglyceride synthetase